MPIHVQLVVLVQQHAEFFFQLVVQFLAEHAQFVIVQLAEFAEHAQHLLVEHAGFAQLSEPVQLFPGLALGQQQLQFFQLVQLLRECVKQFKRRQPGQQRPPDPRQPAGGHPGRQPRQQRRRFRFLPAGGRQPGPASR